MQKEKIYNYLEQNINSLQSNGKLSFSLAELRNEFSSYSLDAIKLSLNRLSKKGKIVSVYKGFYVIIPPEYSQRKILPPELFLDSLFKYLDRPYYLGLLSAAAMHGASHQQAMESYVFINKPPIRPTKVEGIKINYVVKSEFPEHGLEQRKTAAGYLNISGPELTALDLVEYQQRVGGLNRISTIIYELSESMQPEKLKLILQNKASLSAIQRLGYILSKSIALRDVALDKSESIPVHPGKEISSQPEASRFLGSASGGDEPLAQVLKNYLSGKKIFRVPLKPGIKKSNFPVNPDWKIIENYKIETDF